MPVFHFRRDLFFTSACNELKSQTNCKSAASKSFIRKAQENSLSSSTRGALELQCQATTVIGLRKSLPFQDRQALNNYVPSFSQPAVCTRRFTWRLSTSEENDYASSIAVAQLTRERAADADVNGCEFLSRRDKH